MDDHAPDGASRNDVSEQDTWAIANVVFENVSELAAIEFDTVDQHGAAFHVFVAKTAYALGARGEDGFAPLNPLSAPAPLLAEDRHHADDLTASVQQESDFAPYKPRCDVIVNGTAYAPLGLPVRRFQVSLAVQRARQAEGGAARIHHAPADAGILIAKTLEVYGERSFKRHLAPWRMVLATVKLLTLTLLDLAPWRLTRPARFSQLPIRYEFAEGGACRVDAGEAAARRVPDKNRLPAPGVSESGTLAVAPDLKRAIAHEVCLTNPLGRGFARRWFITAMRLVQLPAPRIGYPQLPIGARRFWRAARGADLAPPAGLGAIGRAWLPRRALAGTFDEKRIWQPDEVPGLPADFDFAYWNSAPSDQQCAHLHGGELVTLINLSRPEHPSAQINQQGHTVLRFALPEQAVPLLLVDDANQVAVTRLVIDTVVIDPDAATVELVWRCCLPAQGAFHTARLMQITTAEQFARLELLEQAQQQVAGQPADKAAQDAPEPSAGNRGQGVESLGSSAPSPLD